MEIVKSINYKNYSLVIFTKDKKIYTFSIMVGTTVLHSTYSDKILSDAEMIEIAEKIIKE